MVLSGVIFDCDGVLCQTKKGDEHYYTLIRSEVGLPPLTEEQFAFVRVATVEEGLRETTPPEKLPELKAVIQKHSYTDIVRSFLRSDPSVGQVLQLLKDHNCKLGVLSNGTQTGICELLQHCEILDYFDDVVTADTVTPKPSPEGLVLLSKKWGISLEDMIFVGDGMTDYGAAKMTPVHFIAFDNHKIPSEQHIDTFADLLLHFTAMLSKE